MHRNRQNPFEISIGYLFSVSITIPVDDDAVNRNGKSCVTQCIMTAQIAHRISHVTSKQRNRSSVYKGVHGFRVATALLHHMFGREIYIILM